jgi:hypothetical protein
MYIYNPFPFPYMYIIHIAYSYIMSTPIFIEGCVWVICFCPFSFIRQTFYVLKKNIYLNIIYIYILISISINISNTHTYIHHSRRPPLWIPLSLYICTYACIYESIKVPNMHICLYITVEEPPPLWILFLYIYIYIHVVSMYQTQIHIHITVEEPPPLWILFLYIYIYIHVVSMY